MLSRRAALLALFSIPLVKFDAFAAKAQHRTKPTGGVMTVNLDDWQGILVQHHGQQIGFSNADIFAILAGRDPV